jgi:predicted acetyltransferase
MSLAFREAREGDVDRLVDIHIGAYPDARGFEARRRNFVACPFGKLSDLVVAEDLQGVVAHAFLFPLRAWFGGVRVQIGGIASVAVASEARGRGVGHALLQAIHSRALARGDALTVLYPFRQGYYARQGYAAVSSYRHLVLSPNAVPRAWGVARGARVRVAEGADREALVRVHEAHGAVTTGWLARPDALWERRLASERRSWFVVDEGGTVTGYVAWTLAQAEPHAKATLRVDEIVAGSDSTYRLLLAHVASQRDQIAEVWLDVADGDPLERGLTDLDGERFGDGVVEHALGAIAGGPMVFLLDVRRAITARGYLGEGAIDIAVGGEPAVHVQVREGAAAVTPSTGGPHLRLGRETLGAVLYGALSVGAAVHLGLAEADDPRTVQLADSLFALPPFFSVDPF